ncbi:MAG: 1-acyl-sn-glycerol-3-phosphate acyltransferase [Turicibacter sp.]|nr:1-acyl-sn-glycerol-3-phosphate acyltransferase [Turicibacter sp.]
MANIWLWVLWAFLAFLAVILIFVLWLNLRFIQLDRKSQDERNRFISWVTGFLIPLIFRIRVNAKGLEYLNGVERAALFPNHQSLMDIPVLLSGVKRPHGYVAKKELDHIFLISRGMKLIRCEFMDRKDPRQSVRTISNATKTVKEGHMMVIFPEGTRVVRGEEGLFKAGSFKIAQKAGADIFPVTIFNTPEVSKRWPRMTTVDVQIHPPVTPEEYAGLSTAEIAKKVEAIVKNPLRGN